MMKNINAQRAEIEQLVANLECVVRDIEGSIQAMNADESNGISGLRDDVWQMEQEVTATR